MIEVLNNLLNLIKEVLIGLGMDNETVRNVTTISALIFILIFVIKQIYNLYIFWISHLRKKELIKDLHPFFTQKEIEFATRYYINTKFQNVPPSEDEEPGRNYIAAASQPLLPLFLDKAFRSDIEDSKYYLVLADSGMGKTTFMINLYLNYKYQINWFRIHKKYNIELLPLGHPYTLERIKGMHSQEKKNTILLLDAFDEDNKAIINYTTRLNEILDLIWEFREVVITCRTQFFPSSNEEPTETGKFKFGPEGGQHHFQKIYISVFSEKDIKKYLKKRFKSFYFFKTSKYLKALAIVLKAPNLMMRPMLLSYIDDLLNMKKEINYGFQIYEVLIDQWLIRESNKAGIVEKYGKSYKSMLYEFSKALAKDLYINKTKRNNRLSLNVNEIIDNPKGLQLKDIEGSIIQIDKYDQGSRSLLNRNAIGEYKFSHKSILEYFIALEVYENEEFRNKFHFDRDLDVAKKFFIERVLFNGEVEYNYDRFNLKKLGISEMMLLKVKLDDPNNLKIQRKFTKIIIPELFMIIGSGLIISVLSGGASKLFNISFKYLVIITLLPILMMAYRFLSLYIQYRNVMKSIMKKVKDSEEPTANSR